MIVVHETAGGCFSGQFGWVIFFLLVHFSPAGRGFMHPNHGEAVGFRLWSAGVAKPAWESTSCAEVEPCSTSRHKLSHVSEQGGKHARAVEAF